MKKISIIIPVYNIERYIRQCIESVLNQSSNEFEVILVDDGSTDKSGIICDEYKSNLVKVYHKKNGGLSDARNFGITKADGDYLMFIDGDDYLYNNDSIKAICEELHKDNNIEILQYKMVYYYENKNEYCYLKDLPIANRSENIYKCIDNLNKIGCLSISACDKVVKTELIKDNSIYFKKDLYSEDIDWSLSLYLRANKLSILNENIYVYRQQREGSITTKPSKKRCDDLLYIIKKWYYFNYDSEYIKNVYYNYLAYQLLIFFTITEISYYTKDDYKEIMSILNSLIRYDSNYKTKVFKKIYKIVGLKFGIALMKIYLKLKNKGIVKI